MINTTYLPPFKKMCVTIGNLPTSFMESMSYYEALCWFYNFLDKEVIPAVNANSELVKELQDYMENYFKNLDVQEEINNKLDEMAESGELADIIAQYLELASVLAFNTLTELVAAENIVEGSICRTLGNSEYNDGKGAYYKIRTITSGDVVDGINIVALDISDTLIAEKIPEYDETINDPRSNDIDYDKLGRIVDITHAADNSITGYYGMQGGCVVNGNYVMISNHHSDLSTYADEYSKIRVISLSTGSVLNEYVVEIGHGNSITYDSVNEKYYVCAAHGNVTESSFMNEIIILNSSFQIESVKEYDYNFDSITVDENGTVYAGITYKLDLSNGMKIFKLDSNLNIAQTITLNSPVPSSIGTGQDFAVFGNNIYYLQAYPNSIMVFNMEGNNIMNYNLKDDELNIIGELENISSLGNGEFILGSMYMPTGNLYSFEQIFKINVLKNISKAPTLLTTQPRKNMIVFYVDDSSSVFNPDGKVDTPFKCIDEVLMLNINNPISINLVGNNTVTYYLSRINAFHGEIYAPNGAHINCGDSYDHILIRTSTVYFNSLPYLPSLEVVYNSNVKIYNSTLQNTGYDQLIYVNNNSVVDLEKMTFNISANMTNYALNNNHGLIIWNKENEEIYNKGVTKWFSGKVEVLSPILMYNGTLSKNNSVTLNGGNFASFKNISIRFTDSNEIIYPCKNTVLCSTFCNLSTSGAGNNNFYQTALTLNNGVVTYDKANQISFNSSGVMSVNTSPTFNIEKIYFI